MLSFLSTFFSKPETHLTLDEAYDILQESVQTKSTVEEKVEESLENYETCLKTGVITKHVNNQYTIDDNYEFQSDEEYCIGTRISYQILKSHSLLEIVDVHPLDTEWGYTEINQKSKWYVRTIVSKIVERNERKLRLDPVNIDVDLNKTSTDFIPIVGDWVHLDVKCEVDETIVDLCGKILDVIKIYPLRCQVKTGTITAWDEETNRGCVDRNVFFDKESLCNGYLPCKGEKVVMEIIESEQGICVWRALKIFPNFKKTSNSASKENRLEKHRHLVIENDLKTSSKLGEKQIFHITITNNSINPYILQNAEFAKDNTQCILLEKIGNRKIPENGEIKLKCEFTNKTSDPNSELIILEFDQLILQHWIRIINNSIDNRKSTRYKKPTQYHDDSVRGLITAPKTVPRFVSIKLSDFSVPERLLKLVSDMEDQPKRLQLELERLKPTLLKTLTYMNYEEKFHTLLHLDECSAIIAMRTYNQEKACFIRFDDYLALEIDNLAEKRPSIIVGDKIIARNPRKTDEADYEGIVQKIGMRHVFLKFDSSFHNHYDGEDYAIKAVGNRSTYRRCHNAVDLAIKHLRNEFLFPTKTKEKEPQFIAENLRWFNSVLNNPQKEAVKNILAGICRPLPYIIFGPPGTGKTMTLIEVILQILTNLPHSRLLVSAPSNSAADLLATRLIDSRIVKPGDLVRLVSLNACDSIPAKLAPYTVTANLELRGTETFTPTRTGNGLTLGCSSKVLGRHRITVTTCSSAGVLYQMGFPRGHFTHIIVDEAGQTTEPNLMIPLALLDIMNGQCILAGDPMQLGPVILSNLAVKYGLEESLIERMINRFPYLRDVNGFPDANGYDPRLITKLLYNYRSLPDLLKLPSMMFYHNELIPTICDETSAESHLLQRLEEILPKRYDEKLPRILFHGVHGENFQSEDSPSWYNPHEAAQVFYYINELYRMNLKMNDIAIITPYKAQTKALCELFDEAEFDTPKIGTVEEFQGQEFNVVVLSTVRSNADYLENDIRHSLGFIANPRRLNVSITRAKCLLIIVGNPRILSQDKCWQNVIEYCINVGAYVGCEFIK